MYTLNPQAAKEADTFGAYLQDSGKYVGTFTRAEKLISKAKGTHGIGFTFECNGQTTKFDVWTMKATNEHLQGFKTINAIMACMSLRSIQEVPGVVEFYDWDTKTTQKAQSLVFQDLMGKPIGLVLQKTEYEKMKDGYATGETGWRLELVAPFRAADEFTASEILDRKTKPEKLASIMARLADRPLKGRAQAHHGNDNQGSAHTTNASSGFGDMDDDVPFF